MLSLHEDEIVINPTLSYKLENDFGIKPPEFDESDDISAYFSKVNKTVKAQGWKVIPETAPSLLSFLKNNMYRDLKTHKDLILENPVVRTLSGDPRALTREISELNNYDHDSNSKPEDTYQVVDADASRQDAIICAKKGLSFVLQGPPGIGKSQTITNIIAKCLADGKKVLFVSEKMAALDVVYKRLREVRLDDFCLILHSYKANKKDTLKQLREVLNPAGGKAQVKEDAYRKLTRLSDDRERLNDYAESINIPITALKKRFSRSTEYLHV